jgi:Flp pilus assembly protein TadG
VEFAIVSVLLLTLIIALIVFGALMSQRLALSNAARQAARFGVVEGNECPAIIAEARDNANALSMSGADVDVEVSRAGFTCGSGEPCADSDQSDSVRVELTYESDLLVPLPGLPSSVELHGVGEFRCEFS